VLMEDAISVGGVVPGGECGIQMREAAGLVI